MARPCARRSSCRILLPLGENKLNWAVSIDDGGTRDAPLLSSKRLFNILRLSVSTTMSLLNQSQEFWSIVVALTFSLFFPFALTASSPTRLSNKELFTLLKELQPINTLPPTKEPFKTAPEGSMGSPNFGSNGASRVTFQPKCISA